MKMTYYSFRNEVFFINVKNINKILLSVWPTAEIDITSFLLQLSLLVALIYAIDAIGTVRLSLSLSVGLRFRNKLRKIKKQNKAFGSLLFKSSFGRYEVWPRRSSRI